MHDEYVEIGRSDVDFARREAKDAQKRHKSYLHVGSQGRSLDPDKSIGADLEHTERKGPIFASSHDTWASPGASTLPTSLAIDQFDGGNHSKSSSPPDPEKEKKQQAPGKDCKSLPQNLFDTNPLKLLQMMVLPNLRTSSVSPQTRTQEDSSVAGCDRQTPQSDSLHPLSVRTFRIKHDAQTLRSKASGIESSCHPSCSIQNLQKSAHLKDGDHLSLTRDDYKFLKSTCEFCKREDCNGQSDLFCIPKSMIDRHCRPLKNGTELQLATRDMILLPEAGGEFSFAASPMSLTSLSTYGVLGHMGRLRQLGRTDQHMPMYQCNKNHHKPRPSHLSPPAPSLYGVLCSSDSLLRYFIKECIYQETSKAIRSVRFKSMVEFFTRLHIADFHPQTAFSQLWESADALHLTPPGRPKLPSDTATASKSNQSPARKSSYPLGLPQTVHVAKIILAALVGSITAISPDTEAWLAVKRLRSSSHTALPRQNEEVPISPVLYEKTLGILDALDDDMAHSLLKRLTKAVANHNVIVRSFNKYASRQGFDQSGVDNHHFEDLLVQSSLDVEIITTYQEGPECQPTLKEGTLIGVDTELPASTSADSVEVAQLEIVVEWLRGIVLKEWNGKPHISPSSAVAGALMLLSALYHHYGERYLNPEIFQTSFIAERLDSLHTPTAWMEADRSSTQLHVLNYPFLFRPAILVSYFRAINYARMTAAYREAQSNALFVTRLNFTYSDTGSRGEHRLADRINRYTESYLVLTVRREQVLADAFNQLWRRRRSELFRPLKVRLGESEGEEGMDQGGVQQEFIRIVMAEALEPKYGAFTTDPVTCMSWFQPGSLEPLYKFELLGLLTSLAIYNGLTLPFNFPIALYMKLLGHQPDHLEDVSDGWPDLTSGLRALRDWSDGDVEDVFCRTYDFSVNIFGVTKDVDLTQASSVEPSRTSGTNHMVNNINRYQYIKDYIKFLTHTSIQPQYEAFEKGFRMVINPKSLSLFTPNALQVLVQGIPYIDTHELEKVTQYENGYHAEHPVIRGFWSVIHEWATENDQAYGQTKVRQLLEFVTASDRLPPGGEARVAFIVLRNGVGDERLPTSSTCFGRLLLPEYSSRAVIQQMLGKATENARGFGTL